MSRHHLFPYFLLVLAGVLWGATFSLALIATAKGAHPLAISTWQIILMGVFFIILSLIAKVDLFRFRNLRHYLVLALVGITLPNLAYYNAAPHLSAGILSITVSTVPLFTYAFMLAMRYEPIVLKRVFGIVLGMIAILLLVLSDQDLRSNDANLWILLAVLCAVSYSIENVYVGHGIDHSIDIRELLCGSFIVAACMHVPLSIAMDIAEPVAWLMSDAGLALLGLAIASSIAYSIFFYTIKHSGAVFASQCAYIITISGVVWGIVIFSEQHSLWVWLSVVVMMLGLVLVTPEKKTEALVVEESVIADSVL